MKAQERKKLEDKLLAKLNSKLAEKDTVIAAISGGADSIFLLHFLKQTKAKIVVTHLNHQLRKAADSDEKFVKELVEKINDCYSGRHREILFVSKKIDLKSLSKKHKRGIEEMGRIERYKLFNKLAKKYQAKYILTAHHADDNLETIILNFARGASLEGLAGMQEVENQLFRPLLEISKKTILSYLKDKKIPYKEDLSNKDTQYSRNFVRHEILPRLKQLNPSIEKTVASNTENLRETNKMLIAKAQSWIKNNAVSKNKIPLKNFHQKTEILKKYIIRELYKNIVGDSKNIENIHIQEVLTLIERGIGNKKKKLGKLTLSIQKQHLILKN